MSVIRVEKNRNYSVIHNGFLRNKELSLKSKGLLSLILSLPDDWNYSIAGLVAICKENITAVRNSLKELESFGHVVIEKTKNERGHFIYNYTIYEIPVDSPAIENLALDDVDMEKQHVDNQQQLNTNQLSKDVLITNELNLYIEEQAPPAIQPLVKDYLEMRKEKGTPLSMRGLKMLLKRLDTLSNSNTTMQRLMLENSIQNGWANVYRPKDEEIEAASKALVENLKSFYNI